MLARLTNPQCFCALILWIVLNVPYDYLLLALLSHHISGFRSRSTNLVSGRADAHIDILCVRWLVVVRMMVCSSVQLGSSVHIYEKHMMCLEVITSAQVSSNGIPLLSVNSSILSTLHDTWVSEGPSLKFTLSIRVHDPWHHQENSIACILKGIGDTLTKAKVCCNSLILMRPL